MTSYRNNDQQDHIPPLLPLNKKKAENTPVIPNNNEQNQNTSDPFSELTHNHTKKIPTKGQDKPITGRRKQFDPERKEELEKRTKQKIPTVSKRQRNDQNQMSKEEEKAKKLIEQLMNKMSIKNLTEENYPVSNEVINQCIEKIDEEIADFKLDSEKKQGILKVNPDNVHLKKQLQQVNREIEHCSTIKELYQEKINLRNKIQALQEEASEYMSQIRELKIKVDRGIEQVEKYKHTLPCDQEKQLKEKLNKCEQELKMQKQMRQNLQSNIESIIVNFKRLYEEADQARMIVTTKLKQIEERERKLRKISVQVESEESEEFDDSFRRIGSKDQIDKANRFLQSKETGFRKTSYENETKKKGGNSNIQVPDSPRRTMGSKGMKSNRGQNTKKQEKTQLLSLEERINKMRNNQKLMKKVNPN